MKCTSADLSKVLRVMEPYRDDFMGFDVEAVLGFALSSGSAHVLMPKEDCVVMFFD
ncbi:hypothetical protein LDC_2492, partial [sediment metagenome]